MKIAIETTLFARLPLERAFEQIAACGFKEVELGLSHFNACGAGRAEVRRVKAALSQSGLSLAALFAMGGWNPAGWKKTSLGISSPKERDRTAAVSEMKNAIENSKNLGCKLLVSELTGDMDRPQASATAFKKSIEQLLPSLIGNDMTVCFEAHPGDFEQDSYKAVRLLSSFKAKQVKYNYCVPHTFVLGHEPREIVSNARGLLGYVHFADTLKPERVFFCPTYTPKVTPHLHLIPGRGDIKFREVITSFRAIDYSGYLSLQPFSHLDRPGEAANETSDRLRELLIETR